MKQNTVKTVEAVDMVSVLGESVIESHLKVDYSFESTYIDALASASWASIESRLGDTYGATTYETHQERLDRTFTLPIDGAKVDSITVYYTDEEGTEQTVDSSDISVSPSGYPVEVLFSGGTVGLSTSVARPVRVVYTSLAEGIPTALQQACLMLMGHLYENRQGVTSEKVYEVPMSIDYLCRPYLKMSRK